MTLSLLLLPRKRVLRNSLFISNGDGLGIFGGGAMYCLYHDRPTKSIFRKDYSEIGYRDVIQAIFRHSDRVLAFYFFRGSVFSKLHGH